MQMRFYIAAVAACGLLLGCQKQQSQTEGDSSTTSEKVEVEKKPLAVKGFYIGMPKERVLAMLDSYGLTNHTETTGKLGDYFPVKKTEVYCDGGIANHNGANFYYDENQRLVYMRMDWGMINFLFNAAGGNGRGVAHLITQSWNLPDMEIINRGNGSFLYYYKDNSIEIGVFGTGAVGVNPYLKSLYLSDTEFAYSKWGVIFNN